MLDTPEFWVLVAFVLCVPISLKWIVPKISQSVQTYQESIEQAFVDADMLLLTAQKRFASAKELLNALPDKVDGINGDLEANINLLMQAWQEEQERLRHKYQQAQAQSIQHLKSHTGHAVYNRAVILCATVLHQFFTQHMTAKHHQQIVMAALKKLD